MKSYLLGCFQKFNLLKFMYYTVLNDNIIHLLIERNIQECINSGLDYCNGGLDSFCSYFHCLSHYIYSVVFPLNFLLNSYAYTVVIHNVKSHEP